MRKLFIASFFLLSFSASSAHAIAFTAGPALGAPNPITSEVGNSSATITFSLDSAAQVTINIFKVQNFGDSGEQVAQFTQNAVSGANTIVWNALWLIGGDLGRKNGTYEFFVTASTGSGTVTASIPTLLTINSVDIHNVVVTPSVDASGAATFPYLVQYQLAKDANVTVTVLNSSNTLIRTIIEDRLQANETISTATVTWDGLKDDGSPAPIGVYTIAIDAKDASNTSEQAIRRTRTIPVQSLAGASSNPQELFEENVYVFPNPVRDGQATFRFESIRNGATVTIRVYTLTGDLVWESRNTGLAAGNITDVSWDARNQAGRRVGRGLYYYVVREESSEGTLQVTKKMAVLQ